MNTGLAAANLLRMSSLLDESIALAIDLRAYLERRDEVDPGASRELAVLVEARELAQLSANLGYCLAWLVTREAVHAGELSRLDAHGPGYRLGGGQLRQEPEGPLPAAVPPPLAALALRGRRLYERVARLDHHPRAADARGFVVSSAASL